MKFSFTLSIISVLLLGVTPLAHSAQDKVQAGSIIRGMVDYTLDSRDNAHANRLLVEAAQIIQSAKIAASAGKTYALFQRAHRSLKQIIDLHPSSDLAVKLVTGQTIGNVSLERIENLLETARKSALVEKASHQIWLFRRHFLYRTNAKEGARREFLILTKNKKFYSGTVGDFHPEDYMTAICKQYSGNHTSLPGAESIFSPNSYLNIYTEGSYLRIGNMIKLKAQNHFNFNSPALFADDKLPCVEDVFVRDITKLKKLYGSTKFKSSDRNYTNLVAKFLRNNFLHLPLKLAANSEYTLKQSGALLDGGITEAFSEHNIETMSFVGDPTDKFKNRPNTRLEFKGPYSLKSAYLARRLIEISEIPNTWWGCMLESIDQIQKTINTESDDPLDGVIKGLEHFYERSYDPGEIRLLIQLASFWGITKPDPNKPDVGVQEYKEIVKGMVQMLKEEDVWTFFSSMYSFDLEEMKMYRPHMNLRKIIPNEYLTHKSPARLIGEIRIKNLLTDKIRTMLSDPKTLSFLNSFKKFITIYFVDNANGIRLPKTLAEKSRGGTCGLDSHIFASNPTELNSWYLNKAKPLLKAPIAPLNVR